MINQIYLIPGNVESVGFETTFGQWERQQEKFAMICKASVLHMTVLGSIAFVLQGFLLTTSYAQDPLDAAIANAVRNYSSIKTSDEFVVQFEQLSNPMSMAVFFDAIQIDRISGIKDAMKKICDRTSNHTKIAEALTLCDASRAGRLLTQIDSSLMSYKNICVLLSDDRIVEIITSTDFPQSIASHRVRHILNLRDTQFHKNVFAKCDSAHLGKLFSDLKENASGEDRLLFSEAVGSVVEAFPDGQEWQSRTALSSMISSVDRKLIRDTLKDVDSKSLSPKGWGVGDLVEACDPSGQIATAVSELSPASIVSTMENVKDLSPAQAANAINGMLKEANPNLEAVLTSNSSRVLNVIATEASITPEVVRTALESLSKNRDRITSELLKNPKRFGEGLKDCKVETARDYLVDLVKNPNDLRVVIQQFSQIAPARTAMVFSSVTVEVRVECISSLCKVPNPENVLKAMGEGSLVQAVSSSAMTLEDAAKCLNCRQVMDFDGQMIRLGAILQSNSVDISRATEYFEKVASGDLSDLLKPITVARASAIVEKIKNAPALKRIVENWRNSDLGALVERCEDDVLIDAFKGLDGRLIREVCDTITDGKLGAIVDLAIKRGSLDVLIVSGALAESLGKLDPTIIAPALREVVKIQGGLEEAGKILDGLSVPKLEKVFGEPQVFFDLLVVDKNGLRVSGLLTKFTPAGLDSLDWKGIPQKLLHAPTLSSVFEKLPIEKLDPSSLAMNVLKANNSIEVAEKLLERTVKQGVKDLSGSVTSVTAAAAKELEKLPISQVFGDDLMKAEEFLRDKGGDSLKWVETHSSELEVSMRENIGGVVEDIKATPFYTEAMQRICPTTKVVVYDLESPAHFQMNLASKSFSSQIEIVPGVQVSAESIMNGITGGDYKLPKLDPIEIATWSMLGSSLVPKNGVMDSQRNYESARLSLLTSLGSQDAYFASSRFVDWAGRGSLGSYVVEIVALGPAGGEDAVKDVADKLLLELEDITIWLRLQARARGVQVTKREVIEAFEKIVGLRAGNHDFIEYRSSLVDYELEIKSPLLDSYFSAADYLIKRFGTLLKIDTDGLIRQLEQLKALYNGKHVAFALRRTGEPVTVEDFSVVASQLLGEVDAGTDLGLGVSNDILREVITALIDNQSDANLKNAWTKIRDAIDIDRFRKKYRRNDVIAKFANLMSSARKDILSRVTNSLRIDLKDHPIALELLTALKPLALGNESSVAIDTLEFDLTTCTLHLAAVFHHRHTWNTSDLIAGNALAGELVPSSIKSPVSLSGASATVADTLTKLGDTDPRTLDDLREKSRLADQRKIQSMKEVLDFLRTPSTGTGAHAVLKEFCEIPKATECGSGDAGTVIYVNGMYTTYEAAQAAGVELSKSVKGKVLLIHNPSYIGNESSSSQLDLNTGSRQFGTDECESMLDRAMGRIVHGYANVLSRDQSRKLFRGGDRYSPLVANPTTRQLANVLLDLSLRDQSKKVRIFSDSQGSLIVRNALVILGMFGSESFVRNKVEWTSCGAPLVKEEIWPSPLKFTNLIRVDDTALDILNRNSASTSVFDSRTRDVRAYLDAISKSNAAVAEEPIINDSSEGDSLEMISLNSGSARGQGNRAELPHSDVVGDTPLSGVLSAPSILMKTGDLNADGFDDVMFYRVEGIQGKLTRRIRVMINGGIESNQRQLISISDPYAGKPGTVLLADFNGDKLDDIALVSKGRSWTKDVFSPTEIRVYFNNGYLGFAPKAAISQAIRSQNACRYDFLVASDFDGDGYADVMNLRKDGNWFLNFNNRAGGMGSEKSGKIEYAQSGQAIKEWNTIYAGDLDGDSRADLLAVGAGLGDDTFSFSAINNEVGFSGFNSPKVVRDRVIPLCGLADMNGDARADLLHDRRLLTNGNSVRFIWGRRDLSGGPDYPTATPLQTFGTVDGEVFR